MVLVEGGTLPDASELAGKTVKAFYIGRTEVTWLEWKKVRGWAVNHGYDIGYVGKGSSNDHPVRNVNWYDCVKWCNARSEMEGRKPVYEVHGKVYRSSDYGKEGSSVVLQNAGANGYRLPTNAEWEWYWDLHGSNRRIGSGSWLFGAVNSALSFGPLSLSPGFSNEDFGLRLARNSGD
jgi:hypothetical protein